MGSLPIMPALNGMPDFLGPIHPSAHLPHSPPGPGPQAWTTASASSLVYLPSPPLVPAPLQQTQPGHQWCKLTTAVGSSAPAAHGFAGPFTGPAPPTQALLPEHGMSFHAAKRLHETLSSPWNALSHSPQLRFLFSLGDSHRMSQCLGSPLVEPAGPSLGCPVTGPLKHRQHLLTSLCLSH